jgi:type II secretory pathway pseudopilin PulG
MGSREKARAIRTEAQLQPIEFARATNRRRFSEEGYMLLVAVFLLALLTLSLSVAIPQIAKQIRRDRELEAMHQGKQYVRAIQLYYRKYRRYPPDINALDNTDGIRFLRKHYTDPITGKEDWQPILFGQNKLPTAIGFFGLTSTGVPIAPIGSEGIGLPGSGIGQSGQSTPPNTNGNFTTTNVQSGSNSAADQSVFGGTIIGVTIPSEKRSMLVYKKQQQYSMWEFAYDPTFDRISVPQAGAPGNSAGSPFDGGQPPYVGAPSPPSGTTPSGPWGPNGNLPSPSPPSSPGFWGPNGNLPSTSQ